MSQSTSSFKGTSEISNSGLLLSLAAVLASFLVGGFLTYRNTQVMSDNALLVTLTHESLTALDDILSLNTDAETGQRGFVLTGDDRYLQPYNFAVKEIQNRLAKVERFFANDPEQSAILPTLRAAIDAKHQELEQTIQLRRTQGFDAAREVVLSDRGREYMVQIRAKVEALEQIERLRRAERIAEMERARKVAVVTGFVTSAVGILLAIGVAYLLRQSIRNRAQQEWLQRGQIRLSQAMGGDRGYDELGQSVLKFFAEYLNAHVAAMFVRDEAGYRRVATYGVPAGKSVPERFGFNDTLISQAARDQRLFLVPEVPDGYLTFGSALGSGKPRHLAIVPVMQDDDVNAVFEFGFAEEPKSASTELFQRVSESISAAVKSVEYRENLQSLLEETQRQAEELQAQGEELRVSNEELEEQSRALRESQARLETQQAELEETNTNLEEQTQLLEVERDQVGRAKATLEAQAKELERASQYKSDFLANMSHELRTPLNSSLILAKLLADNPTGNLNPEQVQYAETIRTAGNDLLTLINDILDLSKIEAGHMEVNAEDVAIGRLLEDLRRTFSPVAEVKGITFSTVAKSNVPETVTTDRQRLEQVLKNLISNAVKFTEKGEVTLSVTRCDGDRVAFSVTDTGIGIPAEQRNAIFEAFRQADGTTNRKYGGTGLGLSISRQLTQLLGGDIHLQSEVGRGSTFKAIIPAKYDETLAKDKSTPSRRATVPSAQPQVQSLPPKKPRQETAPSSIADDREQITATSRAILIVEDDESFARILAELAHQLDFLCLIATSAEDGFSIAMEYLPSSVILDIGLPDHSGLWVLDRLKQERRTRHIPVHVISANDYSERAYALGAARYLLKPVKRDEITKSLREIQAKLSQKVGRVLIVEDDPVQQDSLIRLLRSQDVEPVAASTAAECLQKLQSSTFDCMVLDLSLPDASGYALLETLSNEDAYSFPPVIVYTGRQLSTDEEQRLRRYSKSIIIKGAKSPERLLDEVTLFLHRVISDLPPEHQRMLEVARSRDSALEGRRILIVEDDVRNVFALTSMFEQRGAIVEIARNGKESLTSLEVSLSDASKSIDLVLMDVMMPEMDGITATMEIRKRVEFRRLPIIILTAKAMKDDQEKCLAAGANDYMAKPLDVEKLLSLVRVWMPR